MTYTRISISVLVSVFINGAIFMTFGKHLNQWQLSRNELRIGNNHTGIIEKVNLLTTSSAANNANSKPKLDKPVNKLTVQPKPSSAKTMQNNKNELQEKQHNSPSAAAATAAAMPQITQNAKLISSPPALVYPPEAITQNARGKVRVKAVIDIDGTVKSIEVIVSSGFKILDEEAIKWFSKLRFQPAQNGEEKVSSVVNQTISFTLNDDSNA